MHDPLNTLAAITAKRAGFHSLGDVSAETTTPLDAYRFGRPRKSERNLICARTSEGRESAKARGV